MTRCGRCDWSGEPEDLRWHAAESAHPLCTVCARSLRLDESGACQQCVARVHADLADIQHHYALLPPEAYQLRPAWSADRTSGSVERPLPGGDALVLLSPGGAGSDQPSRAGNRDHAADEMPGDPPSVLAVLATWEDDLRHVLGDPPAGEASVAGAAEYLSRRAARAAREHPAFGELAHDLRRLLGRMRLVLSADERPVLAPADCFDCGARLRREWTRRGLADDWECRRCGRRYTGAEYLLACRAKAEGVDAVVTAAEARLLYGVRPGVLRRWVLAGLLAPVEGPGLARYRIADVRRLISGQDERQEGTT